MRFNQHRFDNCIEAIQPSIGTMALRPGESVYVQTPDFRMQEGMDGKHDFAIHLNTNDPENPDFLVYVLFDAGS
jgi:hypothetical protein